MSDSRIIKLPDSVKSTDRQNNTARVTTEHRNSTDETSVFVRKTLCETGERVKPANTKFMGAAVVFYYSENDTPVDRPVFQTLCQTVLEAVPEGFADFGHKRLQDAMMRVYGKEAPKIRQDL